LEKDRVRKIYTAHGRADSLFEADPPLGRAGGSSEEKLFGCMCCFSFDGFRISSLGGSCAGKMENYFRSCFA
jgi:hypothetical protein